MAAAVPGARGLGQSPAEFHTTPSPGQARPQARPTQAENTWGLQQHARARGLTCLRPTVAGTSRISPALPLLCQPTWVLGWGAPGQGFPVSVRPAVQRGTTHVWMADTCPHCSGGLKSKATEPADSVSGEGRFLVHRWRLPAVSYHREGLKLYRVPTGTLIPLTRDRSSRDLL